VSRRSAWRRLATLALLAGCGPAAPARDIGDTAGVYRPADGTFHLRTANAAGPADLAVAFETTEALPVAGDWDGDGTTTVGIYRDGVFTLCNDLNAEAAGLSAEQRGDLTVAFGLAGDLPVAGDWDGDGFDSVGVYRQGVFHLLNRPVAGPPDLTVELGGPGDLPLAGDWDGDGKATLGVFRPQTATFHLLHHNRSGVADIDLAFGQPGDQPVVGDWDGDGRDTVGVYRNGTFHLRNADTAGTADLIFDLGRAGDRPVAGRWRGGP
jgi:hypothetical protein